MLAKLFLPNLSRRPSAFRQKGGEDWGEDLMGRRKKGGEISVRGSLFLKLYTAANWSLSSSVLFYELVLL